MQGLLRCVLLLSVLVPAAAAPLTREFLVREVEARAAADAAAGLPRATPSDLVLLYGKDAASQRIEPRELVAIYENAYRRAAADRSLFDRLAPHGGWIFGAITLVLLIFRDALVGWLKTALGRVRKFLYTRVAGTRVFRFLALSTYRNEVRDKFSRIILPFRPDKPLDMEEVYVPLRVKGAASSELIDVDDCLGRFRRMMVVGNPGAGKSMLLKNIVYRYSAGAAILGPRVPILLELYRLNEGDTPLETLLVDAFDRNGFPRATAFVEAALASGRLMLLFDGLDEVSSAKRRTVVNRLRDFLERHKHCDAVITCRGAVYNNEFAGSVNATLEVAEFTDQQVRTFLKAWQPYLPPTKSVERLMNNLIVRPQIMALARNPLLLTIIAFLYSDTEFELPHSRAQFYVKAIDVLLDQWNVTQNHYSAAQKTMVLRHLALLNHDRATDLGHDIRTMELPLVVKEIQGLLPNLDLSGDHAASILKEIVERSGLLMMIDGGERCQFVHLTLQEFLAATALRQDADGLLRRVSADPAAWREVAKLWCGLDVDSTRVIRGIREKDTLMAFECLADAQNVDGALAEQLIDSFKPEFGHATNAQHDAVIRAFAAAASDHRPRGQAILKYLAAMLESNRESAHAAAALALSQTNLPAAAAMLARLAEVSQAAFAALGRMGDVAIHPIMQSDHLPVVTKIKLLFAIGTPAAACRLTTFLWDGHDHPRAAAYIAALLPAAGVEEALASMSLTPEQRQEPAESWVWQPFTGGEESSLPVIVNRAAFLITISMETLPEVTIDERIATALAVLLREEALITRDSVAWVFPVDEFRRYVARDTRAILTTENIPRYFPGVLRAMADDASEASDQERDTFFEAAFRRHSRMSALLRCVPLAFRVRLCARLLRDPEPVMDDWRRVLKPVDYTFATGWHLRAVLGLTGLLTAATVVEVMLRWSSPWKFLVLPAVVGLMFLFKPDPGKTRAEAVEQIFERIELCFVLPVASIAGLVMLFESVRDRNRKQIGEGLAVFFAGVIGTAFWLAILTFATLAFHRLPLLQSSLPAASTLTALIVVTGALLWWRGKRVDRAARNPLHGLLRHGLGRV